jgi:anhydro-N-acetylmuramic acid kinase
MSGTSMDGVDVALVDLDTNQCVAGMTRPYSEKARCFLEEVLRAESVGLGVLSQLSSVLGREFGQAVLELLVQAHCAAKDVVAVGSHGQTICHDAMAEIPYTVQLGCPHTIAEMTGIRVVADFRTRDIVVGGQGAPFAPLYHQALFGHHTLPLAIVNIGGIANVTFLEQSQPPRGYDTGPGNCLMDAWIRQIRDQQYDADGAWASSGHVIQPLLTEMLSDPYFQQKPPKSLGKEYFSRAWLNSKLHETYAPVDVQATLLELTAITIAQAVSQHAVKPSHVVLCGGGVHNRTLHHAIQRHLSDSQVVSSAHLGVDPDFIEAMMFAWLAEKTIHNVPVDLAALTGANKPVILGAVYPGNVE